MYDLSLQEFGLFEKNPCHMRSEDRGSFQKPGMRRIPGKWKDYLTVPRSLTLIVTAGIASIALETVISPLYILATRAA